MRYLFSIAHIIQETILSGGQLPADGEPTSRDQKSLDAIAELIGCSPDIFAPGSGISHPLLEVSALIELWMHLPSDSDRAQVLGLARRLARS